MPVLVSVKEMLQMPVLVVVWAFATWFSGRSCSPATDLVLWEPICPRVILLGRSLYQTNNTHTQTHTCLVVIKIWCHLCNTDLCKNTILLHKPCPVIWQQKLLSSPWVGALKAALPKVLFSLEEWFLSDTGIPGRSRAPYYIIIS